MGGRVEVDVVRRQVSVGGNPVPLTRLEFDLLAVLASRPREVFTREQLLERVWHSNAEWQSPATVTEHVRRLRSKLDLHPDEPSVIATFRGCGYAFDPGPGRVGPEGEPASHDPSHGFVILEGTRIVDASPAMAVLLGLDGPDDLLGHETFDFIADESLPTAHRLAAERACGEVPRPERITLRRPDAREVPVDVATSLVNWRGRPCHQVSVWPVPEVSVTGNGDAATVLAEAEGLLRRAGDQHSRRSQSWRRQPLRDQWLATEIRRGIEAGEFEPYYQPVVHLETDRVLAVEALARWNHPSRGTLRPASFLTVAEETGDIIELGRQLLRTSCAQVSDWQRTGRTVDLAVNISARQLLDPALPADVASALKHSGLAADRLVVEITETDLIEDLDGAATALGRISSQGVRVAIDDFGTGWASLTYLQRFPINILKIDRSFTTGVVTNPNETAIARAVISLGNELDLLVIAEGIETAEQKAAMFDLGCWIGQGYHFGKPRPGQAMELALSCAGGLALSTAKTG